MTSTKPADPWPSITHLLDTGGQITLGQIFPIDCAITAGYEHNTLVMLQRREGETLPQMLDRLDASIERAWDNDEPIDEINPGGV